MTVEVGKATESPRPQSRGDRALRVAVISLVAAYFVLALISFSQQPAFIFELAHCLPQKNWAYRPAMLVGFVSFFAAAVFHWRQQHWASSLTLLVLFLSGYFYCHGYESFAKFKASELYPEEVRKCCESTKVRAVSSNPIASTLGKCFQKKR